MRWLELGATILDHEEEGHTLEKVAQWAEVACVTEDHGSELPALDCLLVDFYVSLL